MLRALWALAFLAWLLAVSFLALLAEGYVPKTVRQVLLGLFVLGPVFLFGQAILELLFEIVAYSVGRIVLPVLTLGTIRSERLSDLVSFPWHGMTRASDGKYVASAETTAIVGLVAIVLAIAGAAACYALRMP